MVTLFYLGCIIIIIVIWTGRIIAIKNKLKLIIINKNDKILYLKEIWMIILLFFIDFIVSIASLIITGGGRSIFGLQILILVNTFTTIFGKKLIKTSKWYGEKAL